MISLPPFMADRALRKRIQKRIAELFPRGWRQAQADYEKYDYYVNNYGRPPPAEAVRKVLQEEISEWHTALLFDDMERNCEL